MANKKFSQFTLGTTHSDIEYVVGYKSTDNIQIVPAALDSTYELDASVVQGGASIVLEGVGGPSTGNIFNIQLLGGDHIDVSNAGQDITITNTQKNTFMVTGTFQNLFGGSPGIFGDTLEFGVKAVPAAGNSSVLTIPFDCKLVSASVKWISNSAVTILNASDEWQVKLFKMTNPTGSVTLTANYGTPVDITGILLTTADNNTFPAKFATGLDIDLVAGDIINISGVESGTIGTSDGEMEMTLGFEAV
jgi:hypothetical protein